MVAYSESYGTLGFRRKQLSEANKTQIGGTHYKKGGEEHWDRAYRLRYDCFQYIITKWVERWRDKGGIEDLEKAHHALTKYLEVVRADATREARAGFNSDPMRGPLTEGSGPGRGYVDQDGRC
jgi:hypothetical protein